MTSGMTAKGLRSSEVKVSEENEKRRVLTYVHLQGQPCAQALRVSNALLVSSFRRAGCSWRSLFLLLVLASPNLTIVGSI